MLSLSYSDLFTNILYSLLSALAAPAEDSMDILIASVFADNSVTNSYVLAALFTKESIKSSLISSGYK